MLNGRGVMLLNKTASEALGMPAAVKLLYDGDQRCIGLKPSDMRHSNAFPVKQKDKWHNRVIHITSFVRHFGIDIRRTVLFYGIGIDIDREAMMKLKLNRTRTIGKA